MRRFGRYGRRRPLLSRELADASGPDGASATKAPLAAAMPESEDDEPEVE